MVTAFLACLIAAAAGWFIARRNNRKLCPACGGTLVPDDGRYRGVVVWTCSYCKDTFETLSES